jgi:hypothetical protein
MRLRNDKKGRLARFGVLALGIVAEMAFTGAFFVIGVIVCVAFLVIHA